MSTLINAIGEGYQLATPTPLGIGTGAFNVGTWYNLQGTGGFDFAGLADDVPITFGFLVSNGDFPGVYFGAGTVRGDVQINTSQWYYFHWGRDNGVNRFLNIFDDSTSTTPVVSGTLGDTDTYGSTYDQLAFGDVFSGSAPNYYMACARCHVGVTWSNAQARLESQKLTPQTAGGTVFGNWKLETHTNDASGYQDSSGAGHHLAVNGTPTTNASRPSQLESAGGGALDDSVWQRPVNNVPESVVTIFSRALTGWTRRRSGLWAPEGLTA